MQFNARPYKGEVRKRELTFIQASGDSLLDAAKNAREQAALRIGTRIANVLCQVFTVYSVEVRLDLFYKLDIITASTHQD